MKTTKILITMGDGSKFEVLSTLSFKDAVEDLIRGDCSLCQVNRRTVINVFQIAYIEDITNADLKTVPGQIGGGSKSCS